MKLLGFAVLFLTLALAIASDSYVHHNGQPGCKTEEELRVQKYRNNWDPTAFWICNAKNKSASKERCPPSTLFQDSLKSCIPAMEWEWTEAQEPPSRP